MEWFIQRENIQPITQGRKMDALLSALPMIADNKGRERLFEARKEKFEGDLKAICDDLNGQLDLWFEYIDWLEQNVPDGGKINGMVNEAIERCIELFYDKKEFKQDKRLFEIFMKFKRFCDEPIEIFGFMYANSICTLLARFYLSWSWQYECRKNMKRAEDLIKLGLRNLASPREVLEEAHEQLKYRLARMIRDGQLDELQVESLSAGANSLARETQEQLSQSGIRAALQTLKCSKRGGKVPINRARPANVMEGRNVGGLKSQTRVINGVRVPRDGLRAPPTAATSSQRRATDAITAAGAATTTRKLKPSNKPILVFNDDQENAQQDAERGLMLKVPTSQPIRLVGRTGLENQIPRSGTMRPTGPTAGLAMRPRR